MTSSRSRGPASGGWQVYKGQSPRHDFSLLSHGDMLSDCRRGLATTPVPLTPIDMSSRSQSTCPLWLLFSMLLSPAFPVLPSLPNRYIIKTIVQRIYSIHVHWIYACIQLLGRSLMIGWRKTPETLKGCPQYSLSCVCVSVCVTTSPGKVRWVTSHSCESTRPLCFIGPTALDYKYW